MFGVGAVGKEPDYALNVFGSKVVVVRYFDKHLRSVDEEGVVVAFCFFEHHDASGDAGAKEEVDGKLDDAVDVVVIHKILADLTLGASAVHDAGEADDGGGAAGGEPGKAVHDERHIGFGFGRQHAGGGETRVVDEQGVFVALPFDGIGRVGDDGFEGFEAFVLGVEEGVAEGDVELIVADIVEEHVDAAEVVGGEVDFLPKEALADVVFAEDFGEVEQERAGPAGGVVNFVYLGFVNEGEAGEQFGDVLGGEELAAAFAGVGSIHGHEIFIGVAEGVDVVVLVAAEGHLADAVHEGDQALVAFDYGAAELVAVDVDVVEEPFEFCFAFGALG